MLTKRTTLLMMLRMEALIISSSPSVLSEEVYRIISKLTQNFFLFKGLDLTGIYKDIQIGLLLCTFERLRYLGD